MGLIQWIFRMCLYFLTLLFSVFLGDALAGWSESQEIIQGSWGSNPDQFGILHEDTADMFPRFSVTSDGKLVIRDGINKRLKVYTGTGSLETIVPYRPGRHYTELSLADSYGFSGDFVGYGEGGANYFYRADQKLYIIFSPAGQLIKTSTTRPLELGSVSEKAIAEDSYKITVKYPDTTYELTAAGTFMQYVRDTGGNLYTVNDNAVWRFNRCGKQIAEFVMPSQQTESVTSKSGTKTFNLPVQSGQPVVGPNGDVYTWKKGTFKYSIVKWAWVDDPNVPSGPDAPTGLSVIPSTSGLYLTWQLSPNDPGCVTGYEIARATTSGGVFSTVGTVEKGVIKYNDTTAAAGTMYYYKVRAMAGSEYSNYTAEISGKR